MSGVLDDTLLCNMYFLYILLLCLSTLALQFCMTVCQVVCSVFCLLYFVVLSAGPHLEVILYIVAVNYCTVEKGEICSMKTRITHAVTYVNYCHSDAGPNWDGLSCMRGP